MCSSRSRPPRMAVLRPAIARSSGSSWSIKCFFGARPAAVAAVRISSPGGLISGERRIMKRCWPSGPAIERRWSRSSRRLRSPPSRRRAFRGCLARSPVPFPRSARCGSAPAAAAPRRRAPPLLRLPRPRPTMTPRLRPIRRAAPLPLPRAASPRPRRAPARRRASASRGVSRLRKRKGSEDPGS